TVHGLSDAQLGEHPTVSALCLGGLIKHVAAMEELWIRFVTEGPAVLSHDLPDGVSWADIVSGRATEYPQSLIDYQAEFQLRPDDTLAGSLARYERVAARTEEVIAAVDDLSASQPLPEAPWYEPGAR